MATYSRTTTPVVLTTLEYDGVKGFGEASMPPYLGESHESVLNFLSKVDMEQFRDPFLIEDILAYVDGVMPGNHAAKASLDIAWLTERSPLPILADEALQTVEDLLPMKGVYSGINIKLMKCGGMHAAYKMITMARQMGMKILIGCMTETSCAVSAAAQLSPLVDWADLDGNLLISNDVYDGMTVVDGKITLPDRPGIGIIEKKSGNL